MLSACLCHPRQMPRVRWSVRSLSCGARSRRYHPVHRRRCLRTLPRCHPGPGPPKGPRGARNTCVGAADARALYCLLMQAVPSASWAYLPNANGTWPPTWPAVEHPRGRPGGDVAGPGRLAAPCSRPVGGTPRPRLTAPRSRRSRVDGPTRYRRGWMDTSGDWPSPGPGAAPPKLDGPRGCRPVFVKNWRYCCGLGTGRRRGPGAGQVRPVRGDSLDDPPTAAPRRTGAGPAGWWPLGKTHRPRRRRRRRPTIPVPGGRGPVSRCARAGGVL